MKTIRSDLRSEKTFDALTTAMQELLSEKNMESITVKELCERARTRTATFYNHFSDKYDFFAFMVRRVHRKNRTIAEENFDSEHPEDFYIGLIKNSLDFLSENQPMAITCYGDTLLMQILQSGASDMEEIVREHLKNDMASFLDDELDLELFTQAFVGAISRCCYWWVSHQDKATKEQVIDWSTALIKDLMQTPSIKEAVYSPHPLPNQPLLKNELEVQK